MNYIYLNLSVLCHSLFAMSLARFAFRNPNGITCGYAAFDLLLQNSSITKRCFVILSKAKNLLFLHISLLLRSLTALQDDRYAIIVLCSLLYVICTLSGGHAGTAPTVSVLCTLYSVLCYLFSVLYTLYLAFLRSFAALQDDRYAIIALFYLFSILCTLFQEHPCIPKIYMHAVLM